MSESEEDATKDTRDDTDIPTKLDADGREVRSRKFTVKGLQYQQELLEDTFIKMKRKVEKSIFFLSSMLEGENFTLMGDEISNLDKYFSELIDFANSRKGHIRKSASPR